MRGSVGVLRLQLESSLPLVEDCGDVTEGDVHLLVQVQRTQRHLPGHVLSYQTDDLHRSHQVPQPVRAEDQELVTRGQAVAAHLRGSCQVRRGLVVGRGKLRFRKNAPESLKRE